MNALELNEYQEIVSPIVGEYLVVDYCWGSGRYQEGNCRCVSHPWYTETSITLAEAFRLAKQFGCNLKEFLHGSTLTRTVWLLVMIIFSVACHSQPAPDKLPAASVASPPIVESKAVTELRAEAAKRNLKWHISCHGTSEWKIYYIAWAVPVDATFRIYIEDGAKPGWFQSDLPTQDAAAVWLLRAIKRQPNNFPDHKPLERDEPPACNSIITGGER